MTVAMAAGRAVGMAAEMAAATAVATMALAVMAAVDDGHALRACVRVQAISRECVRVCKSVGEGVCNSVRCVRAYVAHVVC